MSGTTGAFGHSLLSQRSGRYAIHTSHRRQRILLRRRRRTLLKATKQKINEALCTYQVRCRPQCCEERGRENHKAPIRLAAALHCHQNLVLRSTKRDDQLQVNSLHPN